jgi:ribonucleoside-diphosphate reductase alpha chain
MGDKWKEFEVYHHALDKYWKLNGKTSLEDLPDYFITSDNIDWLNRIEIQSAIQRHIDHSISSTINLPAGTSSEVINSLYIKAWKRGLKGVTIYVDGSRSGVLVSKEPPPSKIIYRSAPKRSNILDCTIHRATVKGEDWTILVGLMDDRPYEIFGGLSEYVEIPKKFAYGQIRKRSRKTMASKYDLIIGKNGDEITIKDIVSIFDNPNHTAFTRTISLAMRHGVPVHYLVEQLQKDKDADLFSLSRVIARCLKKYIADGTKPGNGNINCNCESPEQCNVVYQEGCATCLTCGYAKCG